MSGVTLFALAIGESHQIFLRQYIVIALADDGFSGAADELLGIFRSEKIRRFDEDVTGFTPQLIADDRADIIVEIVRIVEVGENDEDGVVCGEDRGEIIKIGRASCRESVCQYVSISVVAVSLKQKETKTKK